MDGLSEYPSTTSSESTARFRIGTFGSACTGVLISPTIILTAAHCMRGFGSSTFDIRFLPEGSTSFSSSYAIAGCTPHPDAATGTFTDCTDLPSGDSAYRPPNDLALVELTMAVADVTPRSFAAPRSCLRDHFVPLVVRGQASVLPERQEVDG